MNIRLLHYLKGVDPMDPKSLIVPDFLTLTAMMSYIQHACVSAMKHLTVYAHRLMYLLAGIDLVISVLMHLDEADHLKILIKKIIKYGFFIYLITNYNSLLNTLMKGFMFFGKVAGSGVSKPLTEAVITNPAVIGTYGLYLIKDAVNVVLGQATATVTSDPVLLMNIITLFAIALSYFAVGINLFLLYVEFYILGALSIVLVPFGVNQYTSFISQKVLNAMVNIGIKLMVTVFIIGLVMPFMLSIQLVSPEVVKDGKIVDNSFLQKNLYLLLPSLAMAFLTIHGPNLALSLLSGGSGGFNASAVMGGMMSAARMPQMLKEFKFGRGYGPGENKEGGNKNANSIAVNRPISMMNDNHVYDNSHLSAQNMRNKIG